MALIEDTSIDAEPTASEIAIWAGVLVVAADVLALIALIKARREELQADKSDKSDAADSPRRKTKPRNRRFSIR